MAHVTLVGEGQAALGHRFIYRGPQPECRPCKVKGACLNQELGRRYQVTGVRAVSHPCLLNQGRARVVEVENAPPECSLPTRSAVEGSIVRYEGLICSHAACPNYRVCHPVGIEPGMKLEVVSVGAELTCPLGYEIVPVQVGYAD